MAAPIPCLGYRSRTAAIVALRAQGMRTHEIAERIGITPKIVQDLENSAARSRTPGRNGITCAVPPRYAALLEESARRRGMSVRALVDALIETIARDRMVDAVLDDGGSRNGE